MPNKNDLTIVGHITRDPSMKYTPSGSACCQFSVAVNDGKDDRKTVQFFSCQCWKDLAEEVAETFHKGDAIRLSGPIRSRKYQAKDGSEREVWEVTAFEVSRPVYRKRQQSQGGQSQAAPLPDDDQIPF